MSQRLNYPKLAPAGAQALGAVYGYLQKSGLDPALIDLVFLRISQINGCAFCIDMHSHDLLNRPGVPTEKALLLPAWREAGSLYTEEERAALQWAEAVTRIDATGAPDANYEAAKVCFDDKGLVDLTIGIALINAYNRLAISFRMRPMHLPAQ
jgi:AhpD family alkylhydroperoxidase